MKTARFKWNKKRDAVAMSLAEGHTIEETSAITGVPVRTIFRWKSHPEMCQEIDRLSLMVDVASRAQRMRIAMKVIRKKTERDFVSEKDLLDWLKFAQSETDGAKIDISDLLTAITEERKHALAADAEQAGSGETHADTGIGADTSPGVSVLDITG